MDKIIVDSQDKWLLSHYSWHQDSSGYYRTYPKNSRLLGGSRVYLYLHDCIIGKPVDTTKVVDHRDQNILNNTRKNLRFVSKSINGINTTKTRRNTSGFRGVDYSTSKCKYRARIQVNGKSKHLGWFTTAKLAASAYSTEQDMVLRDA